MVGHAPVEGDRPADLEPPRPACGASARRRVVGDDHLQHGRRQPVPKETLDVSGNGRNARLDNFSRATVWSRSGKDVKRSLARTRANEALRSFLEAVGDGTRMPIDLDSIVATTRATIAVGESAVLGRMVTP